MNPNIRVIDEDNNEFEVEVIDIFEVVDYPGKEYILYTRGKEIDKDNIEVYVSIIKEGENGFLLENISNDLEWQQVQKAINEMGD